MAPILLLALALGFYPETRTVLKELLAVALTELRDIAFTKKIRVSGLNNVTEAEVRESLPLDESVFWWLLNSKRVVEKLRSNMYVSDALTLPCDEWILPDWGCFDIKVIERKPTYIAFIDNESWLIGAEGAFMFPVSSGALTDEEQKVRFAEVEQKYGKLKVIKGLSRKNASPEVVKARFDYATKALKTVERVTGLKVTSGDLSKNGELFVAMGSPEIRARFDFAKEDWKALQEQAARLKILLRELDGKEKDISEIDLAYQRLAVVKMVPEVPVDKKSK